MYIGSRIAVVDHSPRHCPAGVITPPQRHGQAGFDKRDVLGHGGRPADDRPREQVDREGDVGEPGPCRAVGEVGDPGPVRCTGAELPVQQITGTLTAAGRDCGADLAAADQPPHALLAHQPVHGVLGRGREAVALKPGRHLAATVEHLRQRPAAGAAGAQVTQLVDDRCVGARPRAGGLAFHAR